MRTLATLFVGMGLGIVGCGATEDQLRARAAYDFQCKAADLEIVSIDDRTRGVSGCGRRSTYVESCSRVGDFGAKSDCTWVENSEQKKVEAKGSD